MTKANVSPTLEPIVNPSPQPQILYSTTNASITTTNTSHTAHTYQNNMLDPYFMQYSDNSGLANVSYFQNNFNYHSWLCSILVAMRSKKKPASQMAPLQNPYNWSFIPHMGQMQHYGHGMADCCSYWIDHMNYLHLAKQHLGEVFKCLRLV